MAFTLDTSTEFGARVERRLREESVVWLTTVRGSGTPDPSPVWFHWDGQTILIYSLDNTQRIRNIERNPRVALNFDGDGRGGNIVVMTGEAAIDRNAPPAHQHTKYAKKYDAGFKRVSGDAESFARRYSVAIRVTPTALRGH